ncbi:MAG: apolipoprotein N-acyltransferase [Candidatus Omnitrophota bacterium]|jgi:apolipoprotein N-acyltransferase
MLRKIILNKTGSLTVFSALLLAVSYPPFNLWPAAWLAFIPLFNAVEGKSGRQTAVTFLCCGFLFWLGTIAWLSAVTLPGMLLLCGYLALYFACFGFLFSFSRRLSQAFSPLFLAGGWIALEYLRSRLLTGFPWALLGHSQYLNLPAIQIADITGIWGVSFSVMVFNAAFYPVFSGRLALDAAAKRIAPALVCVMAVLTYGLFSLFTPPISGDLRIALIQANIPQKLKWAVSSRDFIINKFLGISAEAVIKDNPDLVIWPEASFPELMGRDSEFYSKLRDSVREWEIPLLFGAVSQEDGGYYNSAFLLSSGGELSGEYRKVHLVPFGEFIPFRKTFGFLGTVAPIGDFFPGREFKIFTLNGNDRDKKVKQHKFAVLICFEDVFPDLSRRFVREGAGFLVNITNDAWFGRSGAPFQHLQSSVFRAVENRVWVVRAANTGVSAVIDSKGKIKDMVRDRQGNAIFSEGYLFCPVGSAEPGGSFYTKNGDILVYLCFILVFSGGLWIFFLERLSRSPRKWK